MRLASIVSRIEKHKRRAKELGKSDLSNDVVFSALAMECFQEFDFPRVLYYLTGRTEGNGAASGLYG